MIATHLSRRILRCLHVTASILLIASCGSSGDDTATTTSTTPKEQTPAQTTAQLSGQVKLEQGLAGVKVSVGQQMVETDSNGFFVLTALAIPQNNRWVVNTAKAGYVQTQQIVNLSQDKLDYSVALTMTEPDKVIAVDLTQPNTLTLNQDQVVITLPAGAVTGGDANSTLSLTYGDPSSERGQAIFPGDYFATNDISQSSDILLESIAFFDISVSDASGNDLSQLTEPAQVSLRLPAIYQTGGMQAGKYQANDTIPWWSYNEQQGTWLREDAQPDTPAIDNALITEVDGELFASAAVTHFSWWNVDAPMDDQACFTVQVLDGDGQPMPNMSVLAIGVTYENTYYTSTNAEGYATVIVKKETDALPEKFKLLAQQGSTRFDYNVTDAAEGDTGLDHLYSSSMTSTPTDTGFGNCTLLTNQIIASYKGAVRGILQDSNGKPIPHYQIYNSFGSTIISDVLGAFTFNSPLDTNFSIFVPTLYAKTFKTTVISPQIDVTITLDLVNHTPEIQNVTLSPSGSVTPEQRVTLIVTASDADNDPLSYQWQASAGQLDTTTGTTVNWTAPATDSGSAQISVTVTDSADNTTNTIRTITWSNTDTATPLIVTVKPWVLTPDLSVAGNTVILHGIDGKSIERTVVTDAAGHANFGIIDRDRVTITMIETFDLPSTGQHTNIETIVDTLERNLIFQLSEQAGTGMFNTVFCSEAEQSSVDIQFINVPANVISLVIPFGYYNSSIGESIPKPTSENDTVAIKFCNALLNHDAYYLIANGIDSTDAQTPPIAHSQAVQSNTVGSSLVLDMANTPVIIPVVNNSQLTISPYALSGENYHQPLMMVTTEPTINPFRIYNVPSSSYYFQLDAQVDNGTDDTPVFSQSWVETQLPTTGLVFNLPAFSAANINYDGNSFSWQASDSAAVDGINLELDFTGASWNIFMAATVTNYVLPTLPANVSSEIDITEADSFLTLHDFKQLTGFDATVQAVYQANLVLDNGLPFFSSSTVMYPFEIPVD